MTPLERYQSDLHQAEFQHDAAQEQAVKLLDDLFRRLSKVSAPTPEPEGLLARWRKNFQSPEPITPEVGLYFWGGVGRGKTYLMDTFFECLPFEEKKRMHFHRFMQYVHRELKTLKDVQNPLTLVADRLASEARVLCFDEFFVSDITDAMLLAGLLQALFDRGVSLVATSNIEPDGLYKDGLQRARFLPAIALLKAHTQVLNVDGGTDYRLRYLEQAEIYHSPLDEKAEAQLHAYFQYLSGEDCRYDASLEIEGRIIAARACGEGAVWFDFVAICDGPRSQADYIEIAREFHSVLISGVPAMGEDQSNEARRFISLVDEFYDRHVKLILSAAVPMADLYSGKRLAFEFQRTLSRLQEMQSHEYLARNHLP